MTAADSSLPASAAGTAYGVGLRIEADTAELLEQVLTLMPPAWRPSPAGSEAGATVAMTRSADGDHTVTLDGTVVAVGAYEDALEELERSVRLHLAFTAAEHIFLHAGAVAYRGKGIVILGSSFSGKTTLVGALVRAGCIYYSDENAVIGPDGLLHPYPKPLGLRLIDGEPGQTPHRIEDLGGMAASDPTGLGLVLAPLYRPGAHWQPARLSPSETVQILLEHAYRGFERPGESLRALHAAALNAAGLKGDRGDADEAARLIIQQLTERA